MKLIRIQEALLTPDLLTTPHQTPYHQTSACSPGQILPFKLYINKTPMANPHLHMGRKFICQKLDLTANGLKAD